MSIEIVPVRSKNRNVFRRSSYWAAWSRILFHDAGGRGMLQMREQYRIPNHIKTIELDLLGSGVTYDVPRIRCHCTSIEHSPVFGDILTGVLPHHVIADMTTKWQPHQIEVLLHADYLPYIDFDKWHATHIGGGLKFPGFPDIALDFDLTLEQYRLAEQRRAMAYDNFSGKITQEDVREPWEALKADWEAKIDRLIARAK